MTALGCVALVPLMAAAGAAAETTRAIRIEYEPPGVPGRRELRGAAPRAELEDRRVAGGGTWVRVRIGARGGRFQGDVAIVEARGREARRRVEGGCTDVTAALALITALALDPTASTAPEPPITSPSASSASGVPAASAPPAASAIPAPASSAPPAPEAKNAAEAKEETPAKNAEHPAAATEKAEDGAPLERAPGHPWDWSVGAQAGLTSGVIPQTMFTVPVFLDVSRRSGDLFSPALRLRFERADSGTVSVVGAGADFTWTAGSADLCPVSWAPWRLRFWPCTRVEAGVLQAVGAEVTPTRSDARPWLTAGAALRARVTIYGPLFAEIEGTAFAPIIRDRFFVEPDTTIQRAPAVAAAGGAGLGVSFW